MNYLIERFGLWPALGGAGLFVVLRYLLFAGGAYLLFYVIGVRGIQKIQERYPGRSRIWSEIGTSLLTLAMFGAAVILIHGSNLAGWLHLYSDVHAYGIWWLPVSFILLVLAHDTYFYWMHRIMHRNRWLMRWHAHHHKSHNPTPFSSFSFHPGEAFLEIAIVPALLLVLPCHRSVLLLFSFFSLFWNVIGHLGFEPFPVWFAQHPVFRWLNNSTHHNMHHRNGNYNFGLYFNWWDTWLRTNDPGYPAKFLAKARSATANR